MTSHNPNETTMANPPHTPSPSTSTSTSATHPSTPRPDTNTTPTSTPVVQTRPRARSYSSQELSSRPKTPRSSQSHASPSLISVVAQHRLRPRSNPRTRTPMRHPSPLLGGADGIVNRWTIRDDDEEEEESVEEQNGIVNVNAVEAPVVQEVVTERRRVIRLGAGMTVGAHVHPTPTTTHTPNTTTTATPTKSTKQGPSHRKVRRWNNDKFIGIASEIARESNKPHMAQLFTEALTDKSHRSHYTIPNVPREYTSSFATLIQNEDGKIQRVKERFVKGEVGRTADLDFNGKATDREKAKQQRELEIYRNGRSMLHQVHARLRNVAVRACRTSSFAVQVINAFETLLVRHLSKDAPEQDDFQMVEDGNSNQHQAEPNILERVLLTPPIISHKSNTCEQKVTVIRCLFNPDPSSKGGFHRLLLHAVCQFHGLNASSTTTSRGRLLTVQGICRGGNVRFVDTVLTLPEERNAVNTRNTAGNITGMVDFVGDRGGKHNREDDDSYVVLEKEDGNVYSDTNGLQDGVMVLNQSLSFLKVV